MEIKTLKRIQIGRHDAVFKCIFMDFDSTFTEQRPVVLNDNKMVFVQVMTWC